MAELPSGTVTFLFTDIEGSTARWEREPEAMRVALARHDAILRAAIAEHGGQVVKTMGDAFHAAFAHAPDALAATLDAQRRLQGESWGEIGPLRVRMALHTGAAEERDGDYYGPPLNRAARLMSAGHGDQILLSEVTTGLVRDALPDGVSLLDLGSHRLKDLIEAERVFQVVDPDLATGFPPLASLDARPNNLPTHPTTLLGRERELVDLRQLFEDGARLVTLTGPGGTGKTRLGLQVAAELLERFDHGAFLVDLAPISDPALVPSMIAQVLGLRDTGSRPILDVLKEYLRSRSVLLLLDNFEQILPAATVVADLLAACPDLGVLATSREQLRLRGEHEYAVPPLALPDPVRAAAPDAITHFAAVALFLERARTIRADFSITDENAASVTEICQRLDGLPLAIELAAARVRLFAPQAMARRLERRLPVLVGGARDLPARQQTLRGAIDWSHDLLDKPEQRLFRRLGVFVGGWTLHAAEAVCNSDGDLDILAGLESLVSKSLVRQDADVRGEPRFGMLETIREYALEQLGVCGEGSSASRVHAVYFLDMASTARSQLFGADQRAAARWFAAEYSNLGAALTRSRTGEVPVDIGLRLAGTLEDFWFMRVPGGGRDWAEAMLRMPGVEARTAARADVLRMAAGLAIWQEDYAAARTLAQESAAVFREVGDLQGAGRALAIQGEAAGSDGKLPRARALFEESIVLARRVGDRHGLAHALNQLGGIAQYTGDFASARALRSEAAAIAREIGNGHFLGLSLAGLAYVARMQDSLEQSAYLFKEALIVSNELQDRLVMLRSLAGLAAVAGLAADHARAARLFGAVEAGRARQGVREIPGWRDINDRDVAITRSAIDEVAFMDGWAEGRAMTLEQAVAYALEGQPSV